MTNKMCDNKVPPKNRQEVEKKMKEIISRCKKAGLQREDIAKLFKFNPENYKKQKFKIPYRNALILALMLIGSGVYMLTNKFEDDKCLIDMPSFITKATRPPEECSMCSDIFEIQRVANLTPELFEKMYAYSGVPIVVTDATKYWKAINLFDYWFFKKLYTETDLGKAARDCQFFPYKTEFKNLYDAFEMDDDRANLTEGTESWYFGWSNCHDSIAKVLRLYYSKPYFLPLSAETNAIDWIFMGGPGDGAQMHVDNVVHPSWQAQLKGRKRWYLAPPPECYYSCKFMDVVMQPGEIIVVDTNRWYHKTEVLPGEISVTIGAEYD